MYDGHDVARDMKREQGDAAPQVVDQDLLEHLSREQVQTRRSIPYFIAVVSVDRLHVR